MFFGYTIEPRLRHTKKNRKVVEWSPRPSYWPYQSYQPSYRFIFSSDRVLSFHRPVGEPINDSDVRVMLVPVSIRPKIRSFQFCSSQTAFVPNTIYPNFHSSQYLFVPFQFRVVPSDWTKTLFLEKKILVLMLVFIVAMINEILL